MIVLSGSSNKPLAEKLAHELACTLGEVDIDEFANGEKKVRVLGDVRGEDVVIIQSFQKPVDSHIIETVLIADALERASAGSVTVVIPWMGYSLQDKVFLDGQSLSARVVADIISNGFVHKVILLDLHNSSITGFFSVPTEHLRALSIFVDYAKSHFLIENSIVVSPDFGGLKQARVFADHLGVDLANVDKKRDLHTGKVSAVGVSDDVKGKICLVYDDVINTGGTVVEVAKILKEHGAKEVHFLVSHGLFAGSGLEKMEHVAIDSVVISDSLYHPNLPSKVKQVSIAGLVAEAVK